MPHSSEFEQTPTSAAPLSRFASFAVFGSLRSGSGLRPEAGVVSDPVHPTTSIPSIIQDVNPLGRSLLQSTTDVSVRSASSVHSEPVGPPVVKDITFWGGLCLLICNTTGPGVVTLPLVAQSAGWVPTVICFVLVGLLSYLSSLFICEAMTAVPGNDCFQANVEFSNLVLCFFGKRYQVFVQVICFLAMQTTNIASIAICAQLFDNLLIQIFHRTCGIQVHPNVALVCVTEQLTSASPFSGVLIMSTGALVALIMIVPLCLMNLSENIWLQIGSCILILLIFLQWTVTFLQHGLEPERVPAIGSDISQMFGSIFFNYAYVTAVPSLANAKKTNVSLHKTVGSSATTMTCLYLAVSILGGMAFEIPNNSSMIHAINASPNATMLSMVAGYTFPIAALITSIPVNIIVLRYNLIQSGTAKKGWANVLAGVLPWVFALPLMTGSGLTTAVSWSSLFFVSAANFVIPFVLYIYSGKHKEKMRRLAAIESAQQNMLKRDGTMTSVAVIFSTPAMPAQNAASGWRRLAFWIRDSTLESRTPDQRPKNEVLEKKSRSLDESGTEKNQEEDEGIFFVYQSQGQEDSKEMSIAASEALIQETLSHGNRSRNDQIEEISPPFLGGNKYTITGVGMCTAKSTLPPRTDSELDLQHSRSEATVYEEAVRGVDLMDPNDRLPQHIGELDAILSLRAVPKWVPCSGLVVAWGSLIIMLFGISATIIIDFVQLA